MEEGLRHIVSSPERHHALEEVKRFASLGELPSENLIEKAFSSLEREEMRRWEGLRPLPNLNGSSGEES
jgi:hypothetical protein